MSKYFCSEAANQAATRAVQVFGAAGLMEGNVAERLFRDARLAYWQVYARSVQSYSTAAGGSSSRGSLPYSKHIAM